MAEATREITLRFLAQPSDVNFGGNVHGGSAMKWLDQTGYVCATSWAGRYCVTAFVGDINFHRPIPVGNLVEAKGKVIHTGRTSMHILVELRSCNPQKCDLSKSVHCMMVFVAVDDDGKSVQVPAWKPVESVDTQLQAYALRIMEMRQKNLKEFEAMKV